MPVTIEVTVNGQPRSDLSSGSTVGNANITFQAIQPPAGTTINTIEDVYNDTFGTASERPFGIPDSYNWALGHSDWENMRIGRWVSGTVGAGYPQKHTIPNTGNTNASNTAYRTIKPAEAIVQWFVVYRGQNNVWDSNVAVEIRRFKIYLVKDNGAFVEGVDPGTNFWGVYTNDGAGAYATWTKRNNSQGDGIVIRAPGGGTQRAIHGAASTRTNTKTLYGGAFPGDYDGAFVTCWARKVKWDNALGADMTNSRLMLQAGGDFWRDVSAGNQDGGATVFWNNPYWAYGRFRYLTEDFQGYNCCIYAAPSTYQSWLGSGKPTLASFQANTALMNLIA